MTKKPPLLRLLAAAAAAALAGGCADRPPDGAVWVKDVWVRLPAAKKQPGAAYFRLEAGSEGTRLTGLSSPIVRRVELHESSTAGGRTGMRRRTDVEFPSRGELVFEPGGKHAMLFGISPRVRPGDRIPITFSFNVAPPVTVEAEVRDPAGTPHDGH
jgi:hypothetical protein